MSERLRTRRPYIGGATAAALLLLTAGCDWLLGPLDEQDNRIGAGWSASVITEGPIEALDLTLDAQGRPAASYIAAGETVRISRLDGDHWTHLDGPSVTPPAVGSLTRLAPGEGDRLWILYPSGDQMYVSTVDHAAGEGIPLATVAAEVNSIYPRPTEWMTESAALAWGADGQLRVVLRSRESPSRLWIFRFDGQSWTIESIPSSLNIFGTPQLAIGPGTTEHIVFAAGSHGRYYWWRPNQGWQQRLLIPGSNPHQLALHVDHSSVIGTRDLRTVRVAVEQYDDNLGLYYWEPHSAVTDENLFWHNLDLTLDSDGLPSVLYITGPLRRQDYQVWMTTMTPAGAWQRERVAGELRLPAFHPINVRMVRDESGQAHVLLLSGESSGAPGGTAGHVTRLMHFTRANLEIR